MKMKAVTLGMAAALALGSVGIASATPVTISNGDFSQVTFGTTTPSGTEASVINRTSGQTRPYWITVNDWQVYNSSHAQALWYESANGALNGPGGPLLAAVTAPPTGSGSFVGLNGDQGSGANGDIHAGIEQQLTGLTAGNRYVVHFEWAAAQQNGVHGPTSDHLQVLLDGNTIGTTGTLSILNHGFSGWKLGSFAFTAGSSSQMLSFMAFGKPSGLPPMALLTNVSISVPEPAELGLFGIGLLGLGALTMVGYRRKQRHDSAGGDSA